MVAFGAALLRAAIGELWKWYKRTQRGKPVTMKLRKGVHIPYGSIERIENYFGVFGLLVLGWCAFLAVMLTFRW